MLSSACGSSPLAADREIADDSPTPDDTSGAAAANDRRALPPRFVDDVMWSAIPRGNHTLASDVDGDGHLDLTATSEGRTVAGLSPGRGDGTFAPTFIAHGDRLEAAFGHVASANVDTASAADELVYLSTRSDNDAPRRARVTSLLAEPERGFVARVSDYEGYAGPFTLADLNGDGQLDVLTAYSGSNAEPRERSYLQALYGRGDGTFEAGEASAPIDGLTTEFVRLSDTDGDGHEEALLLGSSGPHGKVALVDLRASDGLVEVLALPSMADGVLTIDLDRDARSELVLLDAERRSLLVLARSRTAFEIVTTLSIADASYTLTGSVVAGDLDANGELDLVLAGNDTRNTSGYALGPVALIFHGRGFADFTKAPDVVQLLQSPTEFGTQVIARDFDGDAQPELGIVTYGSAGAARIGILRSPIYEVL